MALTAHEARLARRTAKARGDHLQAAYDAGLNKVPWAEHSPPIEGLAEDPEERAAYDEGRAEGRRRARRHAAEATAGFSRRVGGRAAGHLQSAGRSVRDAGAGGGWIGITVVMIGLAMLFVLLTHSTLATTVIGGFGRAVSWFISPQTLPI